VWGAVRRLPTTRGSCAPSRAALERRDHKSRVRAPWMIVATSDGFAAEEFGSGSRPTPVVDAPAWLKALSQSEADTDRATLTPYDRAFLESPPTYEEGRSLLPPEPVMLTPAPSAARRVLSLVLFVAIAGSAAAVLSLAVLQRLGHALPW